MLIGAAVISVRHIVARRVCGFMKTDLELAGCFGGGDF